MMAARDNYEAYDGPPQQVGHDSRLEDGPVDIEPWRLLAELMLMPDGMVDLDLSQPGSAQTPKPPGSYAKKIYYNQE